MMASGKVGGCDQEGCTNEWTTAIAVKDRPPVLRCGKHRPVPVEANAMILDALKETGRMVVR